MIKYEIKTGDKVLNIQARNLRDVAFKPLLKGMNCRKCDMETIISFIESDFGGVRHQLSACCSGFEQRIKDKLNIPG